jgi:hypothetical protein
MDPVILTEVICRRLFHPTNFPDRTAESFQNLMKQKLKW